MEDRKRSGLGWGVILSFFFRHIVIKYFKGFVSQN